MFELKPMTPEIAYCRAVVKAWERLRLLYNVLLLVPGVLLIWRTDFLQHEMMGFPGGPSFPMPLVGLVFLAAIFGVVANVCFCLGPYCEFLLTAWGFPLTGVRSRYLSFGLGVMFSLAVMGLVWLWVELQARLVMLTAP